VFERESNSRSRKGKFVFILILLVAVLSFAKNYFTFSIDSNPELTTDADNDQIELDNNFDANTLDTDFIGVSVEKATNDLNRLTDDPNQSTNNIVEELSFASAEDSNRENNSDAEPKLYCLNPIVSANTSKLLEQSCQRISKRLASVSMTLCEAAELSPSGCDSVSGFPLLVSEFTPLVNREPRGRILVIGGMHGDELTSVSMVFRWIASLKKFHSGLFHWHMVPMMNPDGVLNKWATRTNKNGVDLNRNLPSDDWEVKALKYWKEKVGSKPRRYPGKSAASEPETQWLIDEINTFKPDAIINVHAPYGVVDFDSLVLNSAPKSLGKLHLNLLGTYPGSLGNYAGINRNIPVITLELPHAWEMPTKDESARIWEDIVAWLRGNINTDQVAIP